MPTDYADVFIPVNIPTTEYSVDERRATILQTIFRHGHPHAVKQKEYAEMFGVTQQQISLDVKAVREYIVDNLGSNSKELTQSAFERCYRELLESGKPKDAFDTVMQWNKWLENRGVVTKEPEKIQIEGRITEMTKEELKGVLDGLLKRTDTKSGE